MAKRSDTPDPSIQTAQRVGSRLCFVGRSRGLHLANHFLIAMPSMLDPIFGGAVVYMCEHNEDGALGVIINKPTDMMMPTSVRAHRPVARHRPAAAWPTSRSCSAARSRSSAASCCMRRSANYSSMLKVTDDIILHHLQGRARSRRRHRRAGRTCWSRWAAPAGAPASWRKKSPATAG